MATGTLAKATLGGGCFWCIESVFSSCKGVSSAISGYMGGKTANPSYLEVCSGNSGHVEVVQVSFDPSDLPFSEVLDIFFAVHDPTQLNRQGNDEGTQYRSVIFFHDAEQQQIAMAKIAELQKIVYRSPIVTAVEPTATFYPAEGYHQDYFAKNPSQPYCAAVVRPKYEKFRKVFAERFRK